jgi:replicative DNA helicase Mcm
MTPPPEKEGGGSVSPVPIVPGVPIVPLGGDKGDKRDGRDRGHYLLSEDSGFLEGKSDKDRFAICLYDHPQGLTYSEAATILDLQPDTAKRYASRLNGKQGLEWVHALGNSSPQKYTLTKLGRAAIEKEFFQYRQASAEQAREALRMQEATPAYTISHDLPEQIAIFKAFFEINEEYMTQLLDHLRQGHLWITIPYSDLARHSPEMAELLLERPEEVLKAWQIAIEKMELPSTSEESPPQIQVRVTDLPETVRLSSLGTKHLEHLVQVEAQVLTISERRSMMTAARFECPSCGNILHVLQVEQKFKEPSRCGCGRKGKFKMLTAELVDSCTLLLAQPLTELVGKKVKPSQLKVLLKNDLTRDDVRDHLGLNSMVRIVGTLHKVPIILPSGGQSTRFDIILEAVSVSLLDHYNPQLSLSPERIKQIKEEAAHPRFKERMIESYFPRHVGDDALKIQLLCMSVAMPLHVNSPELRRQADCEALNVIVAGDPGMGKSTNLGNRVLELIPHGGRATGAGASKAGLTIAADSKDKENDLVIPQPGALPSANMGIFLLDELDKMELNEQTVLNEVLSEHTVTITKRGANTMLPARVCFIGFANPRMKTWDLSKQSIQDELNIHYSLLTRCVINVQSDTADEERDWLIAKAILNKGQQVLTPFDDDFIRDYLLYVRGTIHPKLREKDEQRVAESYVKLRKILPLKAICPRFVEQVHSLTLLHAKLHLRQETCANDVEFAKDVLLNSLVKSGFESVGLKVKEDWFGNQHSQLFDHIRAQPGGAAVEDLHRLFPKIDLQPLLSNGDLVEWKAGFIRVLE